MLTRKPVELTPPHSCHAEVTDIGIDKITLHGIVIILKKLLEGVLLSSCINCFYIFLFVLKLKILFKAKLVRNYGT